MIDGQQLLADLQPLRRRLEDDLRERSEQVAELGDQLRGEWQTAREQMRTAQTYEAWRDDTLAQAAVMWLLACVFVRFLEDNDLLAPEPPRLSGPGAGLQRARDQRTLYFQAHPLHSDRDYLYAAFAMLAQRPATASLFDHRHNPVWSIGISGDAATQLLEFWQRVDPATGALLHDFTDPAWQTRFLGDLYQDLSESARKKYALLQTPDFVLQFILDRTLTPAIAEFGFREVRLIDPACGSGHFLLAAFDRLVRQWTQHEPGRNVRELVQRALEQVSGVDLNPFAVAIARFRLLLAALRASGIQRLVDAPAFEMELATGDSLLHGPRPGDLGSRQLHLDGETEPLAYVYATEDAAELQRILGRRYHAVVGNPPYITPKDRALNDAYRRRFGSCHRQYSLGVPFTERLFDLAIKPPDGESTPAGYVGMITANSFMKREFGKPLIERYIPKLDLTHVVDTSGAYLPGHGTPTVILFGRHRKPLSPQVRAVLGINGEPNTPGDAAQGLVWRAIVDQCDRPGSSSPYVSVSDTHRANLSKHPWSIGGGGAAELKVCLESEASKRLADSIETICLLCKTREDDAYIFDRGTLSRRQIPPSNQIESVEGASVRDWAVHCPSWAIFPYDGKLSPINLEIAPAVHRALWPFKELLYRRKELGGDHRVLGKTWWEWNRFLTHRYVAPRSIAFAFIATHNHFVYDRGEKVFNGSAPVIKLPDDATEDDHLALLGLLNSSTACFWMKQVFFPKGGDHVGQEGARVRRTWWDERYEFAATGMQSFPIPKADCRELARALDRLASGLAGCVPRTDQEFSSIEARHQAWTETLSTMIAQQEELDWECYGLYRLIDGSDLPRCEAPPRLQLGQRAFEMVMARKMASGELETTWFERHGSTPVTEIPAEWPDDYREVVRRRIQLIESHPDIALIEQPEYKRRWNVEPWTEQVQRAMRDWLLDRLESAPYWAHVAFTSVARLADFARQDEAFMKVAMLYRGQDTFDLSALVAELVDSAAVPFLPVLRYKASGARKHEQWERTWDLQRQEDAGQPVGEIPVPPKYTSADFANSTWWQLRGKLDVPKERFISYPWCERDADGTRVIAWAGWDHLQQARALATYYVQMKESEGWSAERLVPLLAGLLDLLPSLKQWHNEMHAEFGQRMGDYFEGFVDEEARALGVTRDTLRAWTPPATPRGHGADKNRTRA